MGWLIEAFLDEEMKTSSDYYLDRGFENGKKLADNYINTSARYSKKYEKDNDKAEKFVDDALQKTFHSVTGDREKLKQNVKESEKYANQLHKRMAIERHNNRHPDRKVSNESCWLIEAFLNEEKLDTEDRNAMRDSTFGLPEKRKYPLNDEQHVRSAITYFNKCDPKDEEELAKNIKKAMKKYDMKVNVSPENRFSKYYKKD